MTIERAGNTQWGLESWIEFRPLVPLYYYYYFRPVLMPDLKETIVCSMLMSQCVAGRRATQLFPLDHARYSADARRYPSEHSSHRINERIRYLALEADFLPSRSGADSVLVDAIELIRQLPVE